ncbi:MAG: TraR/DksA family transcriptional regulator [Lentisphaeria bacterium]
MKQPVKKTATAKTPEAAKPAAKKAASAKPASNPVAVKAPIITPKTAGAMPASKPMTIKTHSVTKPVPAPVAPKTSPAKPAAVVSPKPPMQKAKGVVPANKDGGKDDAKRKPAVLPDNLKGEMRKFYDALVGLRNHILDQYRDLSASSLSSTKQAGEELADIGSDTFNRDLGLSMLTDDSRKLAKVEESIDRLLHDEYGHCADCGKAIASARLLAVPFTEVCVDCQSRREDNEKFNPGGRFEEEQLFGEGDDAVEGAADEEEEGEEPAKPGAKAAAKPAAKKKAADEDEDEGGADGEDA